MERLPNKEFQEMIPAIREKGFYKAGEQRTISWPEYNLSQVVEAHETLDFIRKSVDDTRYLQIKGKTGRPLTDPKSLAKAVLACEALGFAERNAQGWMRIIGPSLGIIDTLDDKTIGDAYNKREVVYILKQVFEKIKDSDGILSGDGTGLETTRKQNYESKKKTGEYMTSIVDSREIVQNFDIILHERKAMHKLIKDVYGNSLRLDAGFNDRKLVNEIAEKKMIPYIFPKKTNVINGSVEWKLMYLELFYDVIQWLTEYHIRSHSESFHSSFKRIYGPLTKRRANSVLSQVIARIILHNRRRLSYFNRLAQKG
jgi:transposase